MNRQIGFVILVSLTIIIVIASLAPFLPVREQRFSQLGVLGPDQTIKSYPTRVAVNQPFLLYGYVANHEGNIQDYQVLVKVANQATIVSNVTYANAPVLATYWRILNKSETWLFPMNLSVSHAGNDTRIIFELWSYNVPNSGFEYTGLWNQIWLNVTST
ncbi:MAG TPA: DUF1616 domain-containing protein [Candidatus Bathyarchaeia archaeon]|jgi:uncharacterized membrane protein|nr:DUF1616 domain-containing protein [Candidatus Bathyarchaeia archaeon]